MNNLENSNVFEGPMLKIKNYEIGDLVVVKVSRSGTPELPGQVIYKDTRKIGVLMYKPELPQTPENALYTEYFDGIDINNGLFEIPSYKVGDFVEVKLDDELGWHEGEISEIVYGGVTVNVFNLNEGDNYDDVTYYGMDIIRNVKLIRQG